MTDRSHRADRARGQAGMSLVEVLLATAITSIVMLPLIGWAAFALRQETTVRSTDAVAAGLGLLQSYLPRDVGAARTATATPALGDDCAGIAGDRRGGGGAVRLVTVPATGSRSVYAIATGAGGRPSLWRRQCAAGGGALLGSTELINGVSSVTVTCADRSGRTNDPCGQVLMNVALAGPGGPFKVAAARRIDGDLSTAFGPSGNRPPVAVITSSPTAGYRPLSVTFDGRYSSDPDGSVLTYSWDFADGARSTAATPTHGYATLGSYTVTLTVTDIAGATSTNYVVVTVNNRLPTVVAGADLSVVGPGTVVTFSSVGTSDPDTGGRIASYSWNFGDGSPVVSGPRPTHAYGALGTYSAQLTAVDDDGGSASASVTISVSDVGGGSPNPTAPPTTVPATVPPAAPPTSPPTTGAPG